MSTSDNRKPSLPQRLTATEHLPQDIKISYLLWVIGAVLSVVAAGFIAFSSGTGTGAGAVALLLALLLASLYVYLALRMKEGASWARMVLTVFTSLSAMAIIVSIVTGNFGFSLLGPIIAVIATILMWSRNANPWFRYHSSAQR